ncbi:MAG: helix-turn-helix domain-containing protein [Cyanobacterium sp.]
MDKEKHERLIRLLTLIKNSMNERELAKKMDIPYHTVHAWFIGRASPKVDNLNKIAHYMGISVNTLRDKINQDSDLNSRPQTYVGCYELVYHLNDEEKIKLAKQLLHDAVH